MNRHRNIIIVFIMICFIVISLNSHAQNLEKKIYRKAQIALLNDDFEFAIGEYKQLIKIQPENFRFNYELALIYYHDLNQKPVAIPYFEKAKSIMPKDSIPELHLLLAQSYQTKGMYKKAIETYNHYQNIKSNFIKVSTKKYIKSCELGLKYRKTQSSDITVKNLGDIINSKYSEHIAVTIPHSNEILFTSSNNKNKYDELIESIYFSKYSKTKYSKPIKVTKTNIYKQLVLNPDEAISIASISADGEIIILNYGRYLFKSELIEKRWTEPLKMSKTINFNYITKHASLTADNKNIYFSCASKKSQNNIDIYHSCRLENNTWSIPKKLKTINTNNNEDYPHISEDGKTLYFSSDGYKGMGGYDVYKSVWLDSVWSKPKNLGSPINSAGNDIYFTIDKAGEKGFISSDRTGGFGGMDIYEFIVKESERIIEFNNCTPAKKGNYKVTFDAKQSADSLGSKVYYEWEFGDGNTAQGYFVSHIYKKPGRYKAFLNVIDSATGMKEMHEKLYDIKINNVNYYNFICDSVIYKTFNSAFDASLLGIKDAEINNYYWQFQPDSVTKGPVVRHIFNNTGTHKILLQINYNINGTKYNKCISKQIKVIEKP